MINAKEILNNIEKQRNEDPKFLSKEQIKDTYKEFFDEIDTLSRELKGKEKYPGEIVFQSTDVSNIDGQLSLKMILRQKEKKDKILAILNLTKAQFTMYMDCKECLIIDSDGFNCASAMSYIGNEVVEYFSRL